MLTASHLMRWTSCVALTLMLPGCGLQMPQWSLLGKQPAPGPAATQPALPGDSAPMAATPAPRPAAVAGETNAGQDALLDYARRMQDARMRASALPSSAFAQGPAEQEAVAAHESAAEGWPVDGDAAAQADASAARVMEYPATIPVVRVDRATDAEPAPGTPGARGPYKAPQSQGGAPGASREPAGGTAAAPLRGVSPTLARVAAHAAPTVRPAADQAPQPHANVAPAGSEEQSTQALRALLADSPGGSFQEQLDQRLVSVLLGDPAAARQELALASDEQRALANQLIETLIAIRASHGGDPGREAGQVLARLEGLRETLIPLSDLRVKRVAICRSVAGAGLYDPIEPARFAAGAPGQFVLYCEISALRSQETGDGRFETSFEMQTSIWTRGGELVEESKPAPVRTQWRDRRHECFVAPIIQLPPALMPGEYVVKVTITDKIGGRIAQGTATFHISSAD